MSNKTKIPKGWRSLKRGEQIRASDMLWIWNTGPWTRQGDTDAPSIGQFYRPVGTKNKPNEHGHHWPIIRRLTPRKGRGK